MYSTLKIQEGQAAFLENFLWSSSVVSPVGFFVVTPHTLWHAAVAYENCLYVCWLSSRAFIKVNVCYLFSEITWVMSLMRLRSLKANFCFTSSHPEEQRWHIVNSIKACYWKDNQMAEQIWPFHIYVHSTWRKIFQAFLFSF